MSSNEIRRSFLAHFRKAGHEIVPSAPLVPHNDPTLMFVNAGMVPFKNIFTGLEARPCAKAVSAQKCVRAGGKHNDLDNVGYTARHHTFFEMLGNFSFGDYFKADAIELAWSLITRVWDIPPTRLLVTVYQQDEEARALWRRIAGLGDDRIIGIDTSDNFWTMGDTGPCGPCSEIFFDHGDQIPGGPPGSPDQDGDRFVEIWNLVFMQYNQDGSGDRTPLPHPSIDTGMGLERIAAVLQGVHDNYDIDIFRALIDRSATLTGVDPVGARGVSHRVIADHVRACAFLIADGVLPANEGRGYVLRRIMRRAMRHAHLLGASDPLMHRMAPTLVTQMGEAYPELVRAQSLIESTLEQEEKRFRQTLATGLRLLDEAAGDLPDGGIFPGETAFKLYDTYGFPCDLTEDVLRGRGIALDRAGFDAAMAGQKRAARAAWAGSGEARDAEVWFDIAEHHGPTDFIGYGTNMGQGVVLALVRDGQAIDRIDPGQDAVVITNQTPFYAESGGQIGDTGSITSRNGFAGQVTGTDKPLGKLHAHRVHVEKGALSVGDVVDLSIDVDQRARIRANHSATHLLHAALRALLGEHVTQKGSLVTAERLRFDFSHPTALGAEEIAALNVAINAQIRDNSIVETRCMPPEDAIAAGAMALFGEKYGDEVRVLTMGHAGRNAPYSVELCGGTHVQALGDIGLFHIVSEGAVSSGVRRIEALTGEAARLWLASGEDRLKNIALSLKTRPDEALDRVEALLDERRRLERELGAAKRALALGEGGAGGQEAEMIAGLSFVGQIVDGLNPRDLRALADEARKKLDSGVVALIAVNEGRAAVVVTVTPDLTDGLSAVDLARIAALTLGGKGGGGRPDMAQAGGADASKAADALAAIKGALAERAS